MTPFTHDFATSCRLPRSRVSNGRQLPAISIIAKQHRGLPSQKAGRFYLHVQAQQGPQTAQGRKS